jgi:hypothetical protein
MSSYWLTASMAALILLSGCGGGSPPRVYPDRPDSHAADRAIELYDTDNDKYLDAKELEKVPGLKSAMQQVDTDKDGKLSSAEIAARIQSWADSKLGRMGVSCVITRYGKPLTGATVKFVPEKFLGGDLKTAEGITDTHGVARLATSGSGGSVRGVCPGFYRVEVTKNGETIPAKYNTETQLGQEVAQGAARLANGVAEFDLKY